MYVHGHHPPDGHHQHGGTQPAPGLLQQELSPRLGSRRASRLNNRPTAPPPTDVGLNVKARPWSLTVRPPRCTDTAWTCSPALPTNSPRATATTVSPFRRHFLLNAVPQTIGAPLTRATWGTHSAWSASPWVTRMTSARDQLWRGGQRVQAPPVQVLSRVYEDSSLFTIYDEGAVAVVDESLARKAARIRSLTP